MTKKIIKRLFGKKDQKFTSYSYYLQSRKTGKIIELGHVPVITNALLVECGIPEEMIHEPLDECWSDFWEEWEFKYRKDLVFDELQEKEKVVEWAVMPSGRIVVK